MNVSIVMPAYNAASTVGEALESVLAQTSGAWELVVVDDGSTDTTAEVCRGFAERDPRIRLVRREHGGEAAARNTGLGEIRFDWVLFLDADDWISPNHLEVLTRELEARPELDAVVGGAVRVASDGAHVRDDLMAPPEGDLFTVLSRRAAFAIHSCVVRRSRIESVGGFDPSLRKSEDWDLWLRIARAGARFGAVREVVAYYRMSVSSATSDPETMLTSGIRVLERARASDERVAEPDPAYARGLVGDPVDSQVFYLLTWCAGRLLAAGRDARGLLGHARKYRWPALDPAGVARCIVDGGAVATRQPATVWGGLLGSVLPHVEEYLQALEGQSGANGLAASALQELKKTVLRESGLWVSVIEEYERVIAEQRERITQLENAIRALSVDPAFAGSGAPEVSGRAPAARGHWRLREAGGGRAVLLVTPAPEMFVLEISRPGTRDWDVQLDAEVGRLIAAGVYEFGFHIRSDKPRSIGVGLSQAHEPWSNLGFYENLPLSGEWQEFRAEMTASSDEPSARVHLDCGRAASHIEVSSLRFDAVAADLPG